MRLIDAEKLKTHYAWWEGKMEVTKKDIDTIVDLQPTVEAEPIVRCKDCVYCKAYNDVWYLPKKDALVCIKDEIEVNADDYCSWGR